MTDKFLQPLNINDCVCILHKKYATTTPTLQRGFIKSIRRNIATVTVNGLNDTKHTAQTIIKLNTTINQLVFNTLKI